MTADNDPKEIRLTPSWKQYFWSYLLSILTIPIGIGIVVLYLVRKRHLSERYRVTDTQITSVDQKYHRNIDLVNIENVSVTQSWTQEKLGIGTIELQTSAATMQLLGMENPYRLKETIEAAIAAERKKREKKSFRRHPDPKHKPGSMDKIDYLTGLWQQGLLSEEDFEDQRKNYE
ncbi:MAG: PH domain-containing protein [Balneolaceae bacterium]|nr:PH domain-containing protein [Balneolaceae bacterium]